MTTDETIAKLIDYTAEVALALVQDAVTNEESEHAALWVQMLRDACCARRNRP
jgi:hypothetical protein